MLLGSFEVCEFGFEVLDVTFLSFAESSLAVREKMLVLTLDSRTISVYP